MDWLTFARVASAAAGLAPSTGVMLAARLFAGVGAAMIMPITLAVITSTLPKEERGRAIGVWTGVAGGGGILGMFLSAALVDVADWRWLFVLPVALLGALLSAGYRTALDSRLHSTLTGVPPVPSATAREGVANALEAAPTAGPAAQPLLRAARESFVTGWQHAMWAGVAVLTALLLHLLTHRPPRPSPPAADSAPAPANEEAAVSRSRG